MLNQRLGQGIQHRGLVILILARSLGMIIDLHFETVVHWHPLFARLDRNADEDARIVILVAHLVHHMDHAIANLPARPVKQAHPAVSADQPVFYGVPARANMLPPGQIFAVEKLLPLVGIALANVLIFIAGKKASVTRLASTKNETINRFNIGNLLTLLS